MIPDREQILAMAPDTASVKAADKLVNPSKWPTLQFNDDAIWGECQGSGSSPYQSRIDLNGPAFKCSCPSRKFPCKHGLALFLLFCDRRDKFNSCAEAPSWVSEWLGSRQQKAQQKIEQATAPKPVDEAARAKRQEKRASRVEQGADELRRWLDDAVRLGLNNLKGKPFQYWETLSARMVDAQAPGLAYSVRELGDRLAQSSNHSPIAEALGELVLLLEAFSRVDQLPELLQQDIRSLIGWSTPQEELVKQSPLSDRWLVMSHRVTQDDKLLRQEIFLYGLTSQRFAKLQQYAHATQRNQLLPGWVLGHCYQAAAYFYPGVAPLRAWMSEISVIDEGIDPSAGVSIATLLANYRQQLTLTPWLGGAPVILADVRTRYDAPLLTLSDSTHVLSTRAPGDLAWQWLALTGGDPHRVFGTWNGDCFTPMSLWCDASLVDLQTHYLKEA